MSKWGGRKAAAWSAAVLREYGTVCHLQLPGCTGLATEADHLVPRSVRPDLQYVVSNGRPACRHCNAKKKKRQPRRPAVDTTQFFEHRPDPPGGLRPGLPPGSRQNSVRLTGKRRR